MKLQHASLGHCLAACLIALVAGALFFPTKHSDAESQPPLALAASAPNTVTLTEAQRRHIRVEPVTMRAFAPYSNAAGYVDFNQDRSAPVFSPWAGRILQVLVEAGDAVKRGQTLFLVESADLIEAESSLISAAGQLKQAEAARERAQSLLATQAVAQKDHEEAVSNEQSALANARAARALLRQFGKTDREIDAIAASRHIDGMLAIVSPIHGRVTTRHAAIGQFVQPGEGPAPIVVSDTRTMWLIAHASEGELPRLALGQAISASLPAYPGRRFEGRIAHIASAVDPDTHTLAVRAEIPDPEELLRARMMASFRIQTGPSIEGLAVPPSALVREGDGALTVFVEREGNRFERRAVSAGRYQDDAVHITEGLSPGERIATDGALFLSNALALQTR